MEEIPSLGLTTLCNNVTKLINEHRDEQWQNKLDQIGDHKKSSYTLWNTINYLRGKKPPSHPNTIITIGNKSAVTTHQKASAINKQFVNAVKHEMKASNRKIDKHTKALAVTPIHITSTQVSEAISKSPNNNSTGPDLINIRHLSI